MSWDYAKNKDISPFCITAGSSRGAWWKCDKGHSWHKTVRKQVKNNLCSYYIKK